MENLTANELKRMMAMLLRLIALSDNNHSAMAVDAASIYVELTTELAKR